MRDDSARAGYALILGMVALVVVLIIAGRLVAPLDEGVDFVRIGDAVCYPVIGLCR